MGSYRNLSRMVGLACGAGLVCCVAACSPGPAALAPSSAPATFVGSDTCAGCHAAEHEAWRGSHHDLAMQEPTNETVLGDFDGAIFRHAGTTTTFFMREGSYYVRTNGPGGVPEEFEIAYAFGVEPLQQYLIAFPDGRLQAFSVCWDTRPAGAGGQRWFHLYPGEDVDHTDVLHWTGPMQNWNFMCADCHSTNVQKGYDATADRFDTTWSEIDVSCEACHGPGSRHVAWAEAAEREAGAPGENVGLDVRLKDTGGGFWEMDRSKGVARRSVPRQSDAELQTCARCHSRRASFSEGYEAGAPLMNTHRPALLTEGLYFADGQILDEVYVYGSFLQSAMHAAGVTCSDCHEPHSLRLRAPGNALCATCHAPDRFDVREHHRHAPGSPGASCVSCHMPSRTYMVVDPRHDHSFRVPRPDLTSRLGTPNACTACHADRPAEWAARQVAEWHGMERPGRRHYGESTHAGREGQASASRLLAELVGDPSIPGIVRATAVSLIPSNTGPETRRVLAGAAADAEPLVRMAAAGAAEILEPGARIEILTPLLSDSLRAVRMEAAIGLAPLTRRAIPEGRQRAFDAALREYRESQEHNADRAEAHHNLGLLHAFLGEPGRASVSYRRAISILPSFSAPYVNLADLMRADGREADAEAILREGLASAPESADLHHALGLSQARQHRYDDAVAALRRASELAPGDARIAYTLGIALRSTGKRRDALRVLEQAHERRTGHRDILAALTEISMEAGQRDAAAAYARKLLEISPNDPVARRVLSALEP